MPQRLTELELTPSPRDRAEAMSGLADRLLDLAAEHAPEDVSLPVEDFRRRVRSFRQQLRRETDPQTLCYLVADATDEVADFLDRARGQRADREAELRDLVLVLRQVIETVRGDSQHFERALKRSTEALGKVVELEDLREIKRVLTAEVETIRTALADRSATEAGRFEALTTRVQTLERSLVQAQAAAATDALTSLPNRGAFDLALREWLARAQRDSVAFSLAMVDLDDFKRINDTYGHPIGDRVIVSAAQLLQKSLEPGELATRFGGEEFALLLGAPTPGKARQRVTAMLKALPPYYEYEHAGTKGTIAFTFSAGVTSFEPGDTAETVIKRADEALYDAKRRGKKRVEARPQTILRGLLG